MLWVMGSSPARGLLRKTGAALLFDVNDSPRKLITANEAKRNCVGATRIWEEAWSTCDQGSRWGRFGGCVGKECVLPGETSPGAPKGDTDEVGREVSTGHIHGNYLELPIGKKTHYIELSWVKEIVESEIADEGELGELLS